MSPIQEEFLSLIEVDDQISGFERKYGVSSNEFLRDSDLRSRIPEDDVFQWDAFIAHRVEIRRVDDETRRGYLEKVVHTSGESCDPARNTELALAA
jgi:hypothetical protein